MADSPETNASNVVRLILRHDGKELDDSIKLVTATVQHTVGKIPTARIVLLDGDMPNKDFPLSDSDDFKPGAEIEIKAGYGHEEETIFKGICQCKPVAGQAR